MIRLNARAVLARAFRHFGTKEVKMASKVPKLKEFGTKGTKIGFESSKKQVLSREIDGISSGLEQKQVENTELVPKANKRTLIRNNV